MSSEIEIKLTFKDKNSIIKRLKALKFSLKEEFVLHDRYYGPPGTSMANTNTLVRIREKGSKSELTLKSSCKDDNNVWTREEINVGIDDAGSTHALLAKLGFVLIKENESKREVWRKGDVEFMFVKYSKPGRLEMIELEADSKEKLRSVVDKFSSLVKEASEELFRSFDKK